MPTPTLSPIELDCLRALERSPGAPAQPCRETTLHSLQSLGLVEQFITHWLPLEAMRRGYRLTSAGHKLLRNAS